MRAEAIVFDIPHVLGITHPGVVDFGAPGSAKLALVFGVDDPAIAVSIRGVILILAVISDPAARGFPVPDRLAEPTALRLVQQSALLDVSRPVQRVVVGRQVEVNRLRDVDPTPTVAAQVGKQQPGFPPGIHRESYPGQIEYRHAGDPKFCAPGLSFAAIWIDFDFIRVKYPGGVIRRAEGHCTVCNLDIPVGLSCECLRRTR